MNFRLYKKFLSHSFQEFLIYRSTAIITIVFGLIFFLAEFIAGVIYFDYTETIYGWVKNDYLLLISVASVISYGYQFLFTVAHENLYEFILDGELDYILIRPVNSFLFYSLYRVDFPSLINLFIALCFQVFMLTKYSLNLFIIIEFTISILLSIYLVFLLNQIVITISFWKEHSSAIMGIPEYLIDFSSRPKSIYPKSIQFALIYIVPILLSINLPVLIVKGEASALSIFYIFLFDLFGTIFAIFLWKKGLKKYVSAN